MSFEMPSNNARVTVHALIQNQAIHVEISRHAIRSVPLSWVARPESAKGVGRSSTTTPIEDVPSSSSLFCTTYRASKLHSLCCVGAHRSLNGYMPEGTSVRILTISSTLSDYSEDSGRLPIWGDYGTRLEGKTSWSYRLGDYPEIHVLN